MQQDAVSDSGPGMKLPLLWAAVLSAAILGKRKACPRQESLVLKPYVSLRRSKPDRETQALIYWDITCLLLVPTVTSKQLRF